jgi:hypothetical protein
MALKRVAPHQAEHLTCVLTPQLQRCSLKTEITPLLSTFLTSRTATCPPNSAVTHGRPPFEGIHVGRTSRG